MRQPTVLCLTCHRWRVVTRMATDITCARCLENVAKANWRVPVSQSRKCR